MFPTKSAVRQFNFLPALCLSVLLGVTPSLLYAEDSPSRVYFLHALKEREEGRFIESERLFRKALELEPENPDFHFELGNLYIHAKALDQARTELEQAVMIAPNHVAAHFNLGLVYRELGVAGVAREEFRRVLQLDPNNARAMLQIGYIYQDQGFYDEARQAFEEAYQTDVTNYEARDALENLGAAQEQDQERSQSQMQNSLLAGQQFLRQPNSSSGLLSPFGANPGASQPSGQQALIQAGTLLIQQLLSKKKNENG